jgi:hypothetical protein
MTYKFNDEYVNLIVNEIDNYELSISGKIIMPERYLQMELLAGNPIDRNMSMNGSGLPYPCPNIAFDESPNYLLIPENGEFSNIIFKYPNSYYTNDAKTKILPSLFITLRPRDNSEPLHLRFELHDILPLRTLTYRPHHDAGPLFYSAKEGLIELQGAEATARAYASYKARYDIA